MLDKDEELERIQENAEKVFRSGDAYHPMLVMYRNDLYRGYVATRGAEDHQDEHVAFTEACMMIPFLRPDMAILSFHATSPENGSEALHTLFVYDNAKVEGHVKPFVRDDYGTFHRWVENDKTTMDKHAIIGSHMVIAVIRMLKSDVRSPFRYIRAMMETLSKRGHNVFVVPPSEQQDTIDPDQDILIPVGG